MNNPSSFFLRGSSTKKEMCFRVGTQESNVILQDNEPAQEGYLKGMHLKCYVLCRI